MQAFTGGGSRSVGTTLPETDAEFAAILGLLDMQDDSGLAGLLDKVIRTSPLLFMDFQTQTSR